MTSVTRRDSIALHFDFASNTNLLRARIARSGLQDYESGPEYRDAADVFDPASLASLVGVRVQVTHEPGKPTVGYVRGPVRRVLDGEHEFIEAAIEITDAATRADLARGDLLEISAGYSTELDPTPGVHKGRRYVARQRRIQFDHVALLPRDMRARCGQQCRVHFDSSPKKESPVSDYDPRFPGKSKDYVDSYLAAEARYAAERAAAAAASCACAPRVDAVRRDIVEARTDDEVRAAHEARMRKVYTDSFGTGATAVKQDAHADRRDAFRAEYSSRAGMSDTDVDICIERLARLDRQAAEAAAAPPVSHRIDAATESRIDSASAAAGVNRQDVADMIRMNHPIHRGYTPTEEDIAQSVHSVRLRAYIKRDGFGGALNGADGYDDFGSRRGAK
jgi:hypothetical protein